MAIIPTPAALRAIRRIQWTLDQPAQVNRSGWTGRRTVVQQPGASRWAGSAELITIIGEANVRELRAFFAKLKGSINTFLLEATEGVQHTGEGPSLGANLIKYPVTLSEAYEVVATAAREASGDFPADGNIFNYARMRLTGAGAYGYWNPASIAVTAGETLYHAHWNYVDAGAAGTSGAFIEWYDAASAYMYTDTLTTATSATPTAWIEKTATLTVPAGAVTARAGFYRTGGSGGLHYGAGPYLGRQARTTGLTAGATTLPASAIGAALLKAGQMLSVPLVDGTLQLVILTADMTVDGTGLSTFTFEPRLRAAVDYWRLLRTERPVAQVALSDSSIGWSVDPGQLYGASIQFEEAF